MAKKAELIAEAAKLKLEVSPKATIADLEAAIAGAKPEKREADASQTSGGGQGMAAITARGLTPTLCLPKAHPRWLYRARLGEPEPRVQSGER